MNLHCFIILKNTAKQVAWGDVLFLEDLLVLWYLLLVLTITGHIILGVFPDNY